MTKVDRATSCVVCDGETQVCLDLGNQPLANALLGSQSEGFEAFPLGLASCPNCSHGQLTHFVPPDQLFKNYLYASGTGGALDPYFTWFAAALAKCLQPGGRVLEIACNDGSLLDRLREAGLSACGVDPAGNLTEAARSKGHEVLTGFFPETQPEGLFAAIVAMNVTAHTPDPRALMQGIKNLLAPDGAAIIQTSQAFMLLNGEFDTIYHEHYSFFTPASMKRLAKDCGLRVEARKLVSVHGGSLMVVLRHADGDLALFDLNGGPPFDMPWPSPEADIMSLDLNGATAQAGYARFANRARSTMESARQRVETHQRRGAKVALVGVAAKALTFINAADIKPDLYLDEAALKLGRFVPGADRAIEPLDAARDLSDDSLFLIGAWNFADGLAGKIRAQRVGAPSRFLVCFPEIREFT